MPDTASGYGTVTRSGKETPMPRITTLRVALFRAVLAATGLAAILAASEACGGPIIDGRFDPAEGYTWGRSFDLAVEKSSTVVSGGQLWFHLDPATGDVSVAFIQPLTLIDNTYGATAIGWGKGTAPSGKNHNFRDLVGSDKAQFRFTDAAGKAVLDVFVDYISRTRNGRGTYASLGVTGGNGEVNVGAAADVLAWGTSLDYNFNTLGFVLTHDSPATDDAYTENPDFAGWVYEVIYEVRVSGNLFGAAGFGDVTVPMVHDSPNKIGKNKVFPDGGGEPIPEPSAIALLAVGGGLVMLRRRLG